MESKRDIILVMTHTLALGTGFLCGYYFCKKTTKNKEDDYYICLSRLAMHAGYITINISSPNTEGLRDFHNLGEMKKLLTGINKTIKEKNKR